MKGQCTRSSSFLVSMSHYQPVTPSLSSALSVNPNVAKAGGFQSQGVKDEAVIGYRNSLTTQDMKSSSFPGRKTR
jgi:hypothetical protein